MLKDNKFQSKKYLTWSLIFHIENKDNLIFWIVDTFESWFPDIARIDTLAIRSA